MSASCTRDVPTIKQQDKKNQKTKQYQTHIACSTANSKHQTSNTKTSNTKTPN